MVRRYPHRPDEKSFRQDVDRLRRGIQIVNNTLAEGRGDIYTVSSGVDKCWETAAIHWYLDEEPLDMPALMNTATDMIRLALDTMPEPLYWSHAVAWPTTL
ncbi:MAG: hypothetical protein ACRCY9_05600, partial [Phycicoccus sp.]